MDGEPVVGVDAGKVDVHHIFNAVLQRLAGEAGRAAGVAVGVPVGGDLLVVGAVHGLQPGAVVAPDLGGRGRAGAGGGKVRRKADLAVVGHQHVGNLLGSGQRGSARLGPQHGGVARLAQDPAMGGHALGLVGLGGGAGAKLVLGHHGQAAHQVHRLGGAVHRYIDGLALGAGAAIVGVVVAAVVRRIRRGIAVFGAVAAVGGAVRRGGRGVGVGDLVHRHGLLGQGAFSALVQVGLGGVGRACHIGQACHQLIGTGQQGVGALLHLTGGLAQVGAGVSAVAGRLAAAAVGGSSGALLGVAVDAGTQQGADGGHRLVFTLVLHGSQQGFVRRHDGRCVEHLGLAVLDEAAGDAELHTGVLAGGGQSQEAGCVPHFHLGIPQAAGLDARHEAEVIVVAGQVGAAVEVEGAVALLGRVVVIDSQHLKAIGAARQVEGKAAVGLDALLGGKRGEQGVGGGQHRIAGGGAVQRAGCGKAGLGSFAVSVFGSGSISRVDKAALHTGEAQVAYHAGQLLGALGQVALGSIVVQGGAVALGGRARAQIVAEEPPQRRSAAHDDQCKHHQHSDDHAAAALLALFDHGKAVVADTVGGFGLRFLGMAAARRLVRIRVVAVVVIKQAAGGFGKVLGSGGAARSGIGFVRRLGSSQGLGVQFCRKIRHIIVQNGWCRAAADGGLLLFCRRLGGICFGGRGTAVHPQTAGGTGGFWAGGTDVQRVSGVDSFSGFVFLLQFRFKANRAGGFGYRRGRSMGAAYV